MFLNQPQFPMFYTHNDLTIKAENYIVKTIDFNKQFIDNTIAYFNSITDNSFATYTQKAVNFNHNVAEDAKKIIRSEKAKPTTGNPK
jgi:hypothetical protein